MSRSVHAGYIGYNLGAIRVRKKGFEKNLVITAIACSAALTAGQPLHIAQAAAVENEPVDEYQLDDIVVTADKVEKDLFSTSANMAVIDRKTIEQKHYQNLTDALREVPGVIIENYGNGGGSYTSNSLYINGSKNVVVLIDGMRVNTNGSTLSKFDASSVVDMDTVERIEVLKGSASTLYGSDAEGGVINIITKKAKEESMKTTVRATGGSFGKEQYNVTNIGRDKTGVFWTISGQKDIAGNFSDGHGNTILNHLNSKDFEFKLGKDFDEDTSLVMDYQSYTSHYLRLTDGGIDQTSTTLGKKDNSRLNLVYHNRFSKKAENKISFYRNKNSLQDGYNDLSNLWLMDLVTEGISDEVTYKTKKHTIVGGFEWYQDQIKNYSSTSYGYTSAWKDKNITDRAFYLEDAWDFSKEWNLTSGIRVNDHSIYGKHDTPSFTLAYNPGGKANYYTSYKEFFVSPNQYQLYSPYGSMDLQAETGSTTEFGLNYQFDKSTKGNFHVFERNAKNGISYNSLTNKYYNVSEEHAKGLDLKINKELTPHFAVNAGYTYLYIRPASASTNVNNNGYLPKSLWNIGLNYTENKWDLALDGQGVIDRIGRKGTVVDSSLQSYWIWNAAFNYQAEKDLKVFLRVNNIFNKFYTEQCYDMDPTSTGWYSAPGRNLVFGIERAF